MRTSILGAAIAALLGLTGCGDSPTCEQAVRTLAKNLPGDDRPAEIDIKQGVGKCVDEKWSGDVRTCIAEARSYEQAGRCLRRAPSDSFTDYMKKSKRSEAELNLDAIGKSAKVGYIENAEFPKGSAPLTPAASCCETASKRCPATGSDWMGVDVWDRLDFEMTEDHFFRYSYESDGQTFVARAVGDLDCDGTEVTYELHGAAREGNPTVTLVKPQNRD